MSNDTSADVKAVRKMADLYNDQHRGATTAVWWNIWWSDVIPDVTVMKIVFLLLWVLIWRRFFGGYIDCKKANTTDILQHSLHCY